MQGNVRGILCFLLMMQMCNAMAQTTGNEDVVVHRGVVYGEAVPLGKKKPKTLRCDIYQPSGDADTLRPLVVTLFGGGFVLGHRNYADMELFCQRFAEHGYVAASIDYRLIALRRASSANLLRAGYMGAQDLCMAIRYFKDNSRAYGIDTTRIYLLGQSAGAVIVLHALYLDELERPPETRTEPDPGPLLPEAVNSVAGAVALWGSVFDPKIIDTSAHTPLCLIHGTVDRLVPYDSGYCFASRHFPYVYGSKVVADRLNELDMPNYEFHSFYGEKHALYFDWLCIWHLNPTKFETCFGIALDFFNRWGR